MHNLQNSNEPCYREICAEPLYTFERGGSEVSFDTKTFKCVYVFFVQLALQKPHFMRKLYLHKGREDLVTGCNLFVLLLDRWLWCHSSKWFMKHKNLIIMSSKK